MRERVKCMTKKKKQPKVAYRPTRNYLIYAGIVLVTILLVVYLCDWYRAYQEYQVTIPIIRGTISEIKTQEVEHYLLENENALLYFCTSEEEDCRTFEVRLKRIIKENQLEGKMTYVNLTDHKDFSSFAKEFEKKYKLKESLLSYPTIIYMKDQKVENILQGTEESPLSIDRFQQFLDLTNLEDEA